MKKIVLFKIIVFLICLACKSDVRFNKQEIFFMKLGLHKNAIVGVLNPSHCGSCTDYSVQRFSKIRANGFVKSIVATGKLNQNHKAVLVKSGFKFFSANQEKVERLGIPLAASTYVKIKDHKIVVMKTIK